MAETALITGASGGIGGAVARLFASEGIDVCVNYNKNKAAATALCAWIGEHTSARCIAVGADVSNEAEVSHMFSRMNAELGEPGILVNNAALSRIGLMSGLSAGQWDEMFAVNVRGAFLCSKEALIPMLRKKRGSIINISSMWGITGASCEVCYSASKAALIGFTKALAKEVGPSGVRANCIAPGYVKTAMNSELDAYGERQIISDTPLQRAGSPSDIAQAALYFAQARSDFVTGQVLSVNGGLVI